MKVRGQVDAPIELVVAIIVLVMSMALAFTVINQSETGRCLAGLKTQVQYLQESMLDVALGSSGSKKTVTFTMPRCGDRIVEALEFVKFDAPQFCTLCPGHYGGCWQIIPLARTKEGYVQVSEAISCVELPAKNVKISQERNNPNNSCEPLSTTACPPGVSYCEAELALSTSLLAKASWNTLGGRKDVQTYTITFNKATIASGSTSAEISEIRICAKPIRG